MKKREEGQLLERSIDVGSQVALPKERGGGEIEGFSGEQSCKVEPTSPSTVTGRCLQSSQSNAKKGPRGHSWASVPGRHQKLGAGCIEDRTGSLIDIGGPTCRAATEEGEERGPPERQEEPGPDSIKLKGLPKAQPKRQTTFQ